MPAPKQEITNEYINEVIALGKPYLIVLLKKGPNRNQDEATQHHIQLEHLRHLLQLRAEGILAINGPVLDNDDLKGFSLYNTTDVESVRKYVEEDPSVKSGRLVYEIYSWFGIPGEQVPG